MKPPAPPPITRLSEAQLRAMAALPRDGSPVGAIPAGSGDDRDNILRGLLKSGFVAMWPLRGWCITEEGVAQVDNWKARKS